MQEISVKIIQEAVYQMCKEANIFLPQYVYEKIENSTRFDKQNNFILENVKIAIEKQLPLCQDTGQVIVFVKVGQDVHFVDGNFYEAINTAIKKCYKENYFRKSVVKDGLKERKNTNNNTPCVIHSDIVEGQEVELKIIIKGGGSENVTGTKLLTPTLTKEEINNEILEIVKNAGKNACPPLFVGVGFGQTLEHAVLLSKKAIIEGEYNQDLHEILNKNIQIGLNKPILDVKQLTAPTHIACLPMAVSIFCHANRYHSCKIRNNNIIYTTKMQKKIDTSFEFKSNITKQIGINDILNIKSREKILFSGKIYTARDAAHKKLIEMINNKEQLPIDLKNTIIFYAGPCPNKPNEITGSIGPTTAKRMDNFAIALYEQGVVSTIAKGTRSKTLNDYLEKNNKKYFEVQGGIAAYIAQCVKSSKLIAFEELGTEAIYELEVKNLPMTCVI